VASGTTLVQLAVENASGELMPGGYANVALQLPGNTDALSIPASALIFDRQGLRVATVTPDNKVKLKPITVLRDLGKTIQLGSGLAGNDQVIESPPDGLMDGDPVNVVTGTPGSPKNKS
jgi:multidrug efflux pump subunit AcrA (membrane-fusion protein)